MANNRWFDSANRYGYITRILHWIVALLLAWQFLSMACKLILGRTPLTAFMVGSHAQVGTLLMLLIGLRVVWAVCNRRNRPSYDRTWIGSSARAGHGLLYALMLIVPVLALARQYGSDRPLVVFGLRLMNAQPAKIEWMMAPANALHGLLAWTLLAMIAGHISMVLIHHYRWRDGTASRMVGKFSKVDGTSPPAIDNRQ